MNDAVSFGPLPAGSPALRAIYDVIAADASERDAERIHPHGVKPRKGPKCDIGFRRREPFVRGPEARQLG